MDPPLLLLTGYAAAIAAASFAGGWLPSVLAALGSSHVRTQLTMSFVAGLILGVALYHLLPHGVARLGGVDGVDGSGGSGGSGGSAMPGAVETAAWWAVLGVALMVMLLRFVHFHEHDFSAEAHRGGARSSSWIGIALGLGVHTAIEGVALGTSVLALERAAGGLSLASGGAFLAIFLHKPLDALSITSVMRGAGASARLRLGVNALFALLCPALAFLAFWGAGLLPAAAQDAVIGRALALSAGAFLCISLSDLLPETHFHNHDRGKLAACFLAGVALSYALHLLEAEAHGH